MFGEASLLAEGSLRVASILTDEPTQLFEIERPVFDRHLKELMIRSYTEKGDFLNSLPSFNLCPDSIKTSMVMLLQKKTLPYDHIIVKQGKPTTAVYFILRYVKSKLGQTKLIF